MIAGDGGRDDGAAPVGRSWPVDGILLALGALAAAAVAATRVDPFTTDSLSYLDVAANLGAGRGLLQSVVDFWRPAAPEPLGLWPPLYPALVALVARLGVPLEAAARAVPIAAFSVFAFAFHALAGRALGRAPALLTTLFVLALPGVSALGTHAWSEAPFLALLASCLLLCAASRGAAPGRGRAAAAGLLLGLAALTRYAGVPLVLAAAAAALVVPAGRRAGLFFAAGAVVPPALWLARNGAMFGRPLGPALPPAREGPATQAFELARALRWELLPTPFDRSAVVATLLLAGLAAGLVLALAGRGIGRVAALVSVLLLGTVLAATSLSAINPPTGRYLAPALPFVVLAGVAGLAGGVAAGGRRTLVTGLVAVLAVATGVEALGGATGGRAPGALAARSDRAALRHLVGPGSAPVLSDVGHVLRQATGRAAVQIPPPPFRPRDYGADDDRRWEQAGVSEAVMAGGPPPAGAWRASGSAGRFTRYVRLAFGGAGTR